MYLQGKGNRKNLKKFFQKKFKKALTTKKPYVIISM